jgi:uncharacterized protein YegP (UPF0339 family)
MRPDQTANSASPTEIGVTEFHVYVDTLGYWRWYLCLPNGRRLADSGEFFTRREDCATAIALVQGSGQSIIIEDRPPARLSSRDF